MATPDGEAESFDQRFTELYLEYRLPVRKFVFARLRLNDDATVDDIVHDVFFRIFVKLPEYREMGRPIIHWIFEIARNMMTDWTRRPKSSVFDPELHDLADPSSALDLSEVVSDDFLKHALDNLSERDQMVLRLRYVDGLDLASIGEIIGVSADTMKVVHQRALARVKRVLAGNPPRKTGRPAEIRRAI